MVVTATGMQTQMGQIATMLTSVTRTRSPLQRELDSLTKVLGIIAWTAVAFIVVVGLIRGEPVSDAAAAGHRDGHLGHPDRHAGVRLGPAVARREAAGRGQGGREEPHRRRDARRDQRDQHRQDRHPDDEPDDGLDVYAERLVVHRRGRGLPQDRARSRRSPGPRCRTSPGSRSGWSSTATRPSATTARWSATRPRRRWSCWRPSSASTPRRPAAPTRASPRCRSTPTTSSWRRSTASRSTARSTSIELVKGAPDVVLARCSHVGRAAQRLARCRSTRPAPASTRPTSGWARRACGCSPSPPGWSTTTSCRR